MPVGLNRNVTVDLVGMMCGECGCAFGIPASKKRQLEKTGDTFYCPNGHSRVFRDTTEKKLRRQLAAANAQRDSWKDQATTAERRRRAAKGQVTKLTNRIKAGVCPCCRRPFANLARHMAHQHPDFGASG